MVYIKSSVFSFPSHTWLVYAYILQLIFYFNILSIGFQFQGLCVCVCVFFFFFFWVIVGLMGGDFIGFSKSG